MQKEFSDKKYQSDELSEVFYKIQQIKRLEEACELKVVGKLCRGVMLSGIMPTLRLTSRMAYGHVLTGWFSPVNTLFLTLKLYWDEALFCQKFIAVCSFHWTKNVYGY